MNRMINDIYSYNRTSMENDIGYLIMAMTMSICIFFYGKKNAILSVLPISITLIKYVSVVYTNVKLVAYINSSFIRFIISSYILAYTFVNLTRVILMILSALLVLYLSDKYTELSYTTTYNCLLLLCTFIISLIVRKIHTNIIIVIGAFYSSMVILNGIEILTNKEIGMAEIQMVSIILMIGLTVLSLLVQTTLYRRNTKE